MSTLVQVNTYAYSVTYVTDKLLKSIKDIIRMSGLSPQKLTQEWETLERGLKAWLDSRDLEKVLLEVFNPARNSLVGRWDLEISYGNFGDGGFYLDPDILRYHIQKQGLWPGDCDYRIIASTKARRPDIPGWESVSLFSTDGFVRQSIGTLLDGNGTGVGAAYWRKAR